MKNHNDGTGKFANVEGYDVGGKTGTANRAESGSYNEKLTMASFVCRFSISKPKYLVYVVLIVQISLLILVAWFWRQLLAK